MLKVIRPIFGLEFEMSFSALNARSQRINPGQVLQRFMSVAAARFANLPAHDSSGIFLSNGGRLYLDCGKPEITTPEVMTPTDACRYSRAGEEILLDVSRAVTRELEQVQEIVLSRNNVSYGGNCNSWACHESYGHRVDSNMAPHFIPHAVSRIIYTGAGGFDNCSHGLRFLISPRVTHIRCTMSDNTQRNRGIYNTKDETLNQRGYHRLHVICGEHVSSIRSQWLKMATTAVVVAMVEAGMRPGTGLKLNNPVQAMRSFAEDVTLMATATTTTGESLTAWEIQHRLLEKAKRLQVSGPLESWLPSCLQLWEETLDRLQRGPTAVQRSLDWAIKLDLFQNYARRRGVEWDRLAKWNMLLQRLDSFLPGAGEPFETAPYVPRNFSPLSEDSRKWRGLARQLGLDWNELDLVLAVRQELYEIDARFGELGGRGIFNSLDARGHLDHQVDGVESIEQAMITPPRDGRARLRGEAIQRLSSDHSQGACEWSAVWDYSNLRMLDLSDPFASEESWVPLTRPVQTEQDTQERRTARALDHAVAMYDRGDYESAFRMMRLVIGHRGLLSSTSSRDCHRFMSWIQARRGHTDGVTWLDLIYRGMPETLSLICDHLFIYRFQGLVPGRLFREWCDKGLQLLSGSPHQDPKDIVTLRCSHAYDLLCRGHTEEAWNAYQDGMQPEWTLLLHQRFLARILVEKAETLRRLGRGDETQALLAEAEGIQANANYSGDIADLTMTTKAKIAAERPDVSEAWRILCEVARIQRSCADGMGEFRTLLLMARLYAQADSEQVDCELGDLRERLTQLWTSHPSLLECPLAREILSGWDRWVAGQSRAGDRDRFWGL